LSVKSKILQLYQFLKAANELRFRPVRVLAEQPRVVQAGRPAESSGHADLPPVQTEGDTEVPDTLLRVGARCSRAVPTPPASIGDWLLPNWDDPAQGPLSQRVKTSPTTMARRSRFTSMTTADDGLTSMPGVNSARHGSNLNSLHARR
jgi:hypothetical protein